MTDINTAYWEYVLAKDDETLEAIIENGEGIVRHFAAIYGQGFDGDDLYQTGMIGLLRAAKTYNPDGGAAFSTWAASCVISEIRHYVRRERAVAARQADIFAHSAQEEFDCEDASVAEASVLHNSDGEMGEQERMRSFHLAVEDRVALEQAAARLGELQRKVIDALFYRGLTQQQTAEELGITQKNVSRVKIASLKLMQELMSPVSFHLMPPQYTFHPVALEAVREREL